MQKEKPKKKIWLKVYLGISTIILLLIAITFYNFTKPIIPPNEFTRYYDKQYHFSVKMPKGWVIEERPMGLFTTGHHIFSHPPRPNLKVFLFGEDVAFGIIIGRTGDIKSFDDFYKKELDLVQNSDKYSFKAEGETILNNTIAQWIEMDTPDKHRIKTYYLLKNNEVYRLVCGIKINLLSDFTDTIDTIIKSFQFNDNEI